jgi:hypothetical protein
MIRRDGRSSIGGIAIRQRGSDMPYTLDNSPVPRITATLFTVAALLTSAGPAVAQGEDPKSVCLKADQVDHTKVLNDHQILFYMRGKQVWLNTLAGRCATLPIQDGFAWSSFFPEYCSNVETIRVIRTGEVCKLGEFTPYEETVNHS